MTPISHQPIDLDLAGTLVLGGLHPLSDLQSEVTHQGKEKTI